LKGTTEDTFIATNGSGGHSIKKLLFMADRFGREVVRWVNLEFNPINEHSDDVFKVLIAETRILGNRYNSTSF
jgi:hypothetical protein